MTIGEVQTMAAPEPWVAVDAQGDATATWTGGSVIYSAYKPTGESWQAPVQLSSGQAFVSRAAVDARGDATAVWFHFDGSNYIVQSAYRPSGGSWEAPQNLSEPGEEGGDPQIALDATGDAMVVWDGHLANSDEARVAYRPAGGSWQKPVDVSNEGEQIQALQIALDAKGDAMVAWAGSTKEVGVYDIARAAYKPVGGNWEAPTDLSENGGNAYPSDLIFDASGNAAILWQRSNGTNNILQADYRAAGGSWQSPTSLSKEGSNATDAVLVLDAPGDATTADGDATALWVAGNDGNCGEQHYCVGSYLVQAAGFDTHSAPSEGLEVPATGTVGTPVEMSLPAADVWSPTLEFGDGVSASGSAIAVHSQAGLREESVAPVTTIAAHTYSQPGRYVVTFSSTEVLGYRTSAQRTIVIAAPSGPGPGGESSGSKGSGGGEPKPEPEGTAVEKPAAQTGVLASVASAPNIPRQRYLLRLKLRLTRQTRRAILATGSIRVVCYLNAPGICATHGRYGSGTAMLTNAGSETIAIKLTNVALRAVRDGGSFKLAVTASSSDGHRVTKTIEFSRR